MRNLPTAVKHIIIINVLIMVMISLKETFMFENFALYFPTSPFFRIWQPFTYMFMHGGLAHLFFNMFALYMFGRTLEYVWGAKRFLIYYLVAGIGAGVLQECVQYVHYLQMGLDSYAMVRVSAGAVVPMGEFLNGWTTVGASGAVFGLLLAFGMLHPNATIMLLIPPIPMKAKWFVIIYGLLELLFGVSGKMDSVAHFAHLGGMFWGWLLLIWWRYRDSRKYRY